MRHLTVASAASVPLTLSLTLALACSRSLPAGPTSTQSMTTKTSDLLISTECLTEIEVYLAREYVAAKARLVPPPGLEKYHSVVMGSYRKRQEVSTGDPQDVSTLTQFAVLDVATALNGDDLETLLRESCSG